MTISLDEPEKRDEALGGPEGEPRLGDELHLRTADDRDAFAEALDAEWPGPVPYTLLIAPGGKVIYRKVGAIDPLELKRAIVEHLGRTY